MLKERKQHGRKKMKERKHTVIRKGQKNSTNEHITMILELTRVIRLGWNVQHEGKRFYVARISRIGVSSRNKKICTARQQTNREFVNGLNSHYDPHRNFFGRRINDLQRGPCIARAALGTRCLVLLCGPNFLGLHRQSGTLWPSSRRLVDQ